MKNKLLIKPKLVAIIFSLILGVATANANTSDLKFYAGTGLDYIRYSINNTSVNGFGIWAPVLGIKFCDNFGVEGGYSFNNKRRQNRLLKVNNAYLDIVGFIPIADQIDLIAGLGMGRLMVKKGTDTPNEVEIKNKFNCRTKLGMQYNINNNIGLKALFSYQNVQNEIKDHTEKYKFIKKMKSLGLYIIWTF